MIKIGLKLLILVCYSLSLSSIKAQNTQKRILSLDDCIRLISENNLTLKGLDLNIESSLTNVQQAKNNQLPTIDFNLNYGLAVGRTIDPFSNDYINQQLRFSNTGLGIDAMVFNGFRLKKLINQNEQIALVAELDKKAAVNDITLNVTLQYFQILRSKELLALARTRETTTTKQLKRLKSIYEEGIGNPAAYFDLKSQLASDQLNKLDAQLSIKVQIAQLATWLNIDPNTIDDIRLVDDQGLLEKYPYSVEDVFQRSINNFPSVQSATVQKESDLLELDIIKSRYHPTISLFAGLNSNFSSNANTFTNIGSEVNETGNFVRFDNQDIPVLKNESIFSSQKINYFNQIVNNLSSAIGVSLNIPIFDRKQKKSQLALQKIVVDQSELNKNIVETDLRESIQIAYQQMLSSFDRIQILSKQVEALEESFRVNEIRFESGVSNVVEYLESKNNLETARINLINSRYEYRLRVKVLEFFRS